MNKSRQVPFRMMITLLCFINMGVYGQKKSKTFNETFKVSDNTLLDINTNHVDIQFESWAEDEVVIEATIEVEGATDEEAKAYFKEAGFDILGNSEKITIRTRDKRSWLFSNALHDVQNFQIEMPEFPDMNGFEFGFDLEELVDIPLPISPATEFDHEAFERDGKKYLREWQKEFEKSFDKDHMKKLEEWSERMEAKREEIEKKRAKMLEKREEMRAKRNEAHAKRMEQMTEAREKQREAQMERREELAEIRRKGRITRDSTSLFFNERNGGPNIFYNSSDGLNKNYKVKKAIKIKMPKGMKIKMNVRHGEVELSGNIRNLDAILSHSSLWASIIDGDKTNINASYSPISVKTWYLGQLQTKYSDKIAIEEAYDLKLSATSSDVTIDHIINNAFIQNDFGPLEIKKVSKNFKALDISLKNGELNCKIPSVPFTIYVNGTTSELTYPSSITMNKSKNLNTVINRGFYKNKNVEKSITINSKYSEVVLE